jgi:PEP-CTERM motif
MRTAMKRSIGRLAAAAAMAAATGLAPLPAAALVTLETSISDIACGITDAAGLSRFGNCTGLSFAAVIDPGETAFLRATLHYHYTDQGLPLPTPMQFQVNSLGSNGIVTFNEAAGLYVNSNLCQGRSCTLPPHVQAQGTLFAPLILGLNDQPDDLAGSRDMYIELTALGDLPLPMSYSTTLFLHPFSIVFAPPAAPIPEPASVSLIGAGLIALAWAKRRRRDA